QAWPGVAGGVDSARNMDMADPSDGHGRHRPQVLSAAIHGFNRAHLGRPDYRAVTRRDLRAMQEISRIVVDLDRRRPDLHSSLHLQTSAAHLAPGFRVSAAVRCRTKGVEESTAVKPIGARARLSCECYHDRM